MTNSHSSNATSTGDFSVLFDRREDICRRFFAELDTNQCGTVGSADLAARLATETSGDAGVILKALEAKKYPEYVSFADLFELLNEDDDNAATEALLVTLSIPSFASLYNHVQDDQASIASESTDSIVSDDAAEAQRPLRVFVRQGYTESGPTEANIIQGVLDLIPQCTPAGNSAQIMTGDKALDSASFKNAFSELGKPFEPDTFRGVRQRWLQLADAFVVIRTSLSESSAFELAYNYFGGTRVPVLIAVHESAPIKTTLLRDMERMTDSSVQYVQFSQPEDLRASLVAFFEQVAVRSRTLDPSRPCVSTALSKKTIISEQEQLAQFPQNNAGALGTAYGTSKRVLARLVFPDGRTFDGFGIGARKNTAGEAVFTTGMTGYVEALTDPSYTGQLLCFSNPLIGNYGVPALKHDKWGLPSNGHESNRVEVAAAILSDYSFTYSHRDAVLSLSQWLNQHDVPGIYGVDTRALVLYLRDTGSKPCKLVFGDTEEELDEAAQQIAHYDPNKHNLAKRVSVREPVDYINGQIRIVVVDMGTKASVVRCLLDRGVSVRVVPWNWDLSQEICDGVLISNGPGDPSFYTVTIEQIKGLIERQIPVFGICMGNLLLGLACGGTTYKLKFGNRGHNQPCIDLATGRCYVTSQNHGYAIDMDSLPEDWLPLFVNLNDHSCEGIMHRSEPIMSCQFHPEACGGPLDTRFLYDNFLAVVTRHKYTAVVGKASGPAYTLPTISHKNPVTPYHVDKSVRSVLILGSGALQIGQAGEFDYSGCQAITAMQDDNVRTIVVNPNVATVQTSIENADVTYLEPLTVESVEKIIRKERPDGILLSFGGQTALNLGVELQERGILAKYGVRVLGSSVETIISTEDRDIFNRKLREVMEPYALSVAATTADEAIQQVQAQIGFPVIARAAYALGGLGSGFAENSEELREICAQAFTASPQVLIERDLRGWKELEYEVVRDMYDNCLVVAALENFNPMGVHTGESMVVAPLQTINDDEHFMLRSAAIRIIRHLGVVGECNIQFAMDPLSRQYYVIEVNARLSRSSALASKATGYPLAYISAKIALGYSLSALRNEVTKETTAFFEPSLDYIVVKIPRWDLVKFPGAPRKIGSSMKSVGEVMSIGRSFEEAFQKGLRMCNSSVLGFDLSPESKAVAEFADEAKLLDEMKRPTDRLVHALSQAIRAGFPIQRIHDISGIDVWFLAKLQRMEDIRAALAQYRSSSGGDNAEVGALPHHLWSDAKRAGFSDLQIANALGVTESQVRAARIAAGVVPVVKQIDTLAGEFPAKTNYLYISYGGTENDLEFDEKHVMVLGSGCYRIGSSVEFDWCSVETVRRLRKAQCKTIMINCNPETVSTDHTESDRLYFEELSLERVLDIAQMEAPKGVVVSVGGQQPNNLALALHNENVQILGTHATDIDRAEDRAKFSSMLQTIGVDQPEWSAFLTLDDALSFSEKVGYPVLVRPSYVLSGAAMRLAYDPVELADFLSNAAEVSGDHPVVISKFIAGAIEVDVDGIAQHGRTLAFAMSEHVENAGVHSGDATMILPAHTLSREVQRRIAKQAFSIARTLKITGPFNIQFMVRGDEVLVIETNVRASRSVPFVAKTLHINFITLFTQALLQEEALGGQGKALPTVPREAYEGAVSWFGCKRSQFSFHRLGAGINPLPGVEMSSTGEVACCAETPQAALAKSAEATKAALASSTRNILIALDEGVSARESKTLLSLAQHIAATQGAGVFALVPRQDVARLQETYTRIVMLSQHEVAIEQLRARYFDFCVFVGGPVGTESRKMQEIASVASLRQVPAVYEANVAAMLMSHAVERAQPDAVVPKLLSLQERAKLSLRVKLGH